MLQAEFDTELRIHIWHPKLRTKAWEGLRDVHDHRFTLTSCIMAGTLVDVPYDVFFPKPHVKVEAPYELTEVFEIVHAKEQAMVQKGCSTATDTNHLGTAHARELPSLRYTAGDVYTIERRAFHTTRVEGMCITVVHRFDFDTKLARILGTKDMIGKMGSGIVPESPETTPIRKEVVNEAGPFLARALGI